MTDRIKGAAERIFLRSDNIGEVKLKLDFIESTIRAEMLQAAKVYESQLRHKDRQTKTWKEGFEKEEKQNTTLKENLEKAKDLLRCWSEMASIECSCDVDDNEFNGCVPCETDKIIEERKE